MAVAQPLYTVGHSNHPIERFIGLLEQHEIKSLVDVRSTPFSRFNPQFNQQRLQQTLAEHGMRYVFLGQGLGARSKNPEDYDNGRVNYRKLAASELFQQALAQLLTIANESRTAIMCAEREPLDCHRTILVAREVERAGMPIKHLLANGSLIDHSQVMADLIGHLELPQSDLFSAPRDPLDVAYDSRAAQIAYVKKDHKR